MKRGIQSSVDDDAGGSVPSESARDFLPQRLSLRSLREALPTCRGCELYQHATHVVPGQGPAKAPMMLVGEAPGDEEDKTGLPFVGPAGRLFNSALEAAEIPRSEVFVTNAVKHFHWEPQGKRRLHARPSARHLRACHPWLESEIQVVRPKVIVCLGAIATRTLLGKEFRLTQHRGELIPRDESFFLVTWHPSAIIRNPDSIARRERESELVKDLRAAWKATQPPHSERPS